MQADIAIVVAAYNRPSSLQRLLGSIYSANYTSYATIELVISIDYSGNSDCKNIADAFEWKYGKKTIVQHPQNLGLKDHILTCGNYTAQHDAVIVLEDDLFVSPSFYDYAQQAHAFYKNDQQVAGIALYHNTFNEIAYCPFEPIHDGYDNYFMQVPCSWGQLWTKQQWADFTNYLHEIKDEQLTEALPGNVQQWPGKSSWKKFFYSYLLQTGKWFVYPRIGLSTNFGDAGQHIDHSQNVFQTPLLLEHKLFRFSALQESMSIYDGFFELDGRIFGKFDHKNLSVTFDLNGTKPLSSIKTPYLISSKQCNNPEKQFAVACYPYENNILLNIIKNENSEACFSLGNLESFSERQQFNRLTIDLKRVFLSDMFLHNAVRADFEKSKEFRLGNKLLKPLWLIKKILNRSK